MLIVKWFVIAVLLLVVVAVAAGEFHSLALRSDGKVIGWGANDFRQLDAPPNLSNVVAIAATGDQSVALAGSGVVAPAFILSRPSLGSNSVKLTAPTALGRAYYVEFTGAFPASNWTMLPPLPGDGTVKSFSDPNPSIGQRYYRGFQKP